MTDCKRHGKRWTTSEVLNLQREYELLGWNVEKIATKHKRSVYSILYKLYAEGLTPSLYEATGYNRPLAKVAVNVNRERVIEDEESDTDSSSDFNDDDNISEYKSNDEISVDENVNTLSDRVWSLETSVGQISTMVKQMFNQMSFENKTQMFNQMSLQKKTKKLAPLRKST